jgi:outer membrane immunogenic protein
MKKLAFGVFAIAALVAAPAFAAPPAPTPVYSWTGFYVGANIGGGWGDRSVDFTPNDPAAAAFFGAAQVGAQPPVSFNSSGALGGLQLGYNWQFNKNWIAGFETDFAWTGIKGSGSSMNATSALPTVAVEEKVKWFGTVRARLGYLPSRNFLAYVTGGFAYGRLEQNGSYWFGNPNVGGGGIALNAGGYSVACGNGIGFNVSPCFAGSSSGMATGWTVGGGIEYALWKNLTVKAEYLYISLDRKSLTETALQVFTPGNAFASFNANYSRVGLNVARVGLNFRF